MGYGKNSHPPYSPTVLCVFGEKSPTLSEFQGPVTDRASTDIILGSLKGVHPDRAGGLGENNRVAHLICFCDKSHVSSVRIDHVFDGDVPGEVRQKNEV